jgi:hypothetical protein
MEDHDLPDLFGAAPMISAHHRMTKRGGEELTKEVRRRTPVASPPPGLSRYQFMALRGRAPGSLKESWETSDVEHSKTLTGVERLAVESFTEDPIAPHVEWDTQPHVIRPRVDRAPASVTATGNPRLPGTNPRAALRWIDAFGRVRYANEVHHPGTQGKHMMRNSLSELEVTWAEAIGAPEVRRWAREQARLVA